MHRMKAIWAYMIERWPESAKWYKRIIKTKNWQDFLALTSELLLLEPN